MPGNSTAAAEFLPVFSDLTPGDVPPLPSNVESLERWSQAVVVFGKKHKGHTYMQAMEDAAYVHWLLPRRNSIATSPAMKDLCNFILAWRHQNPDGF